MTISTLRRNDYLGTGTTGPFAYTFKIFAQTDLLVVRRVINTGVETELVVGIDFSVTGVGVPAGGTITLTDALAATETLSIERVRPFTQETDLKNMGRFFPKTHEDAFDHVVMLCQQLQEELGAALLGGGLAEMACNFATLGEQLVFRAQYGFQFIEWAINASEASSLEIDVKTKPHGSGAFTSIFDSDIEPLLDTETENSDEAAHWPAVHAGEWVMFEYAALTSGTPDRVSPTFWATRT